MGIIVLLTGAALVAFFTMRQRLQIRTSLGRINSIILMARNSAMASRAPSRIVVTNVSTEQLGGAYDPDETGAVRWHGEISARVSEPISEWDFEAGTDYDVTPTPIPSPAAMPPDTIIGTQGALAVTYGVPVDDMLDDSGGRRGKALLLDPGRYCDFMRLYSYDAARFSEEAAAPTFHISGPREYALRPDDLRVVSIPAPSPKPDWWDTYHRDEYRYLGRPGLTFDAWIYREAESSPDESARVLLVKPREKADPGPVDRRVDYVIEILPDAIDTPTPAPYPFEPTYGFADLPSAQLYACFRSMVATDSAITMTSDAAYTGRFGIPPGEWHRVTVTWNPAASERMDRLSLYLDGVKRTKLCAPVHYPFKYEGASPDPAPPPFVPPFISTPPDGHDYEVVYSSGLPGTNLEPKPFQGRIDDLRISRIVSDFETLPDGVRFALPGDLSNPPKEISFGWDAQGHLVGLSDETLGQQNRPTQLLDEQNLIVIIQSKNARASTDLARGDDEIPVRGISSFTPGGGLLAIGTLEDEYDPRSRFEVRELVQYGGTQKGAGGVMDRFLECEDYPDEGAGTGLDMNHTAPVAVFQAYLVRIGSKGSVRIDDGTE